MEAQSEEGVKLQGANFFFNDFTLYSQIQT